MINAPASGGALSCFGKKVPKEPTKGVPSSSRSRRCSPLETPRPPYFSASQNGNLVTITYSVPHKRKHPPKGFPKGKAQKESGAFLCLCAFLFGRGKGPGNLRNVSRRFFAYFLTGEKVWHTPAGQLPEKASWPSTLRKICPKLSRGTAASATSGTSLRICSPAFTYRVPSRWPLLTGALTHSSSS